MSLYVGNNTHVPVRITVDKDPSVTDVNGYVITFSMQPLDEKPHLASFMVNPSPRSFHDVSRPVGGVRKVHAVADPYRLSIVSSAKIMYSTKIDSDGDERLIVENFIN
jgi:hypothetical protein